jgi:hypothetical protein
MINERSEAVPPGDGASERPSALGKYAHLPWSSDDFARWKQAEIDREDRRSIPNLEPKE